MAAAGKWKVYDLLKLRLADAIIDLSSVPIKMALFQSTSNCNGLGVGTNIYGDLTNEVANANGYATGGVAVTGQGVVAVADVTTFDCDDVAFAASGGSIVARFAVLYVDATVFGVVKPLLSVCLLDATPANITIPNGVTGTIEIDAAGVFTISGATTD
jgi:hypothetical protein